MLKANLDSRKKLTTFLLVGVLFLLLGSFKEAVAGGTCTWERVSPCSDGFLGADNGKRVAVNNCDANTPVCRPANPAISLTDMTCVDGSIVQVTGALTCAGCISSADCSGDTPVCNTSSGKCAACNGNDLLGCKPSQKGCVNGSCVECDNPADCGYGGTCEGNICKMRTCSPYPGDVCQRGSATFKCCSPLECVSNGRTGREAADYCRSTTPLGNCNCGAGAGLGCSPGQECVFNGGAGTVCNTVSPAGNLLNGICRTVTRVTQGASCSNGTCYATSVNPQYPTMAACTASACEKTRAEIETGTPDASEDFPELTDPTQLINFMSLFMAGILVVAAGYQIAIGGYNLVISEGDPTKLQEGRELLTHAVTGLIFGIAGLGILRWIVAQFVNG